jgi:glycosyltransferase involved in cell wall biosynthesis
MKTVFFTQNTKRGGLDTFILNLIASWPEEDEVILFCNRSHPGLAALSNGLAGKAVVIPYDFWIAQDISNRLALVPAFLRALFRAVFWLLGFPYLIVKTGQLFKKNDADRLMVINGGYPGGDACLAATIAWQRSAPDRRAWHSFHNLVLPYSSQPFRRLKERLVDRLVARAAAGFVTVSRACLATRASRPLLMSAQGEFIYNGIAPLVPALTESLAAELGLSKDSQIILMLAVYESRKGHAFLIRAMEQVVRRVQTATLLICGDGTHEEIEVVRRLCDASSARRHIVLQGHRHDLSNLLAQAAVLILPSQAQESFGYTAVEAMACACPVIVTDVGGLPEVVEDGGCGFVVRRDDASGLADRIALLLGDESLRKQMGEAGVQRYRELFGASRMAAGYFNLLERNSLHEGSSVAGDR